MPVVHARAALITIPIGVWKAGDIEFDPPLREKEKAIAKLEAGHVVKIAFRFRERFWPDVNFVHAPDRYMPTWWTAAPLRSPVLTGWAGGHAADALLAERPAKRGRWPARSRADCARRIKLSEDRPCVVWHISINCQSRR